MSKKIEDYLHLYLGCEFVLKIKGTEQFSGKMEFNIHALFAALDSKNTINPILLLRPLSDMTEEEAEHLAWLCMDGRHRSKEYAIDKEEIDIELVPNDGGNMLDDNLEIYIGVTCRCWTGYIAITNYGEIKQCEEDSERREPIDNIAEKIAYLLSCRFDLFNLIPEGLAIDKTLK